MNLFLDTHIFLWYISDDPQLPSDVRDAIRDPSNTAFLSAASVWEAVIKYALGKLPLPEPAAVYLPKQRVAYGISPLPIIEAAFVHLESLPPLHRDPFDRILIAQALHGGHFLATVDAVVRSYPVPVFPLP
jgi:PIN domain nuclease of toxin-antitoxin system